MKRDLAWRRAIVLLLLTACHGSRPTGPTLDWMVGDWEGVRRDADDGSEAPMTVHVAALQGGPGQVERLEVQVGDTPYVGFTVRAPGEPGRPWTMLYANSTRETFSQLEGEVEPDRVVWRSVTPGRSRDSRVVIERLGPDRIRRTNSVSENGGRTWRTLFTDELERSK